MAFTNKLIMEQIKKAAENKESYSNFISMYCLQRGVQNNKNDWDRIMALSPINSVLNKIIEVFRSQTDFPHQIAFFGTLHYLAGYLLSKEIHIDLDGQKIYPDIWNIILAPSGSGKSTVESFIKKLTNEEDIKKLEEFSTAKAYINELSKVPKGLLVKDEWAQLLKGMETQTYLAELKEYFLKTYDNADISRTTGKESIKAIEPALSIYGSTVDTTFTKYVSQEMLLDGFAQRFNYIFCETRNDKKPLLGHNKYVEQISLEFKETIENVNHFKYILSEKAIKEYELLFFKNLEQFEGISYSFFRRTQWKTIKYALLYHILMKKENNIIDEEDIKWADRITFTHFVDLKHLLDMYDEDQAHNIIDKAIESKIKFDSQGKVFTAREITQYLKGKVKNMAEAKLLYDLVINIEKQTKENLKNNNKGDLK